MNSLDFTKSMDVNKNIFLFKLPNGFGKTSLFHAIKWGFYGEEVDFYKDSAKIEVKDFLNDRLDPSRDMFYVEIAFRYGNDNYILKREYKPSTKKQSILILTKNGDLILDNDVVKEELNNIIPINFADFFMFDGEQLSRFMSAQKELNYRDSIHQLLGLKQLRVLRDDLSKLQKRYEQDLTQLTSANKEVDQKKALIEGINREITNLQIKIDNFGKEITEKEQTRDALDAERIKYANLPDVIKKLQEANLNIVDVSNNITEIKTRLGSISKEFFIYFIKNDLRNFITSNEERISQLQDVCGLNDHQADLHALKESMLKMSTPKCNVCGHRLEESEIKRMTEEQEKIRERLNIFKENKNERDILKEENNLYRTFLNSTKTYDFIEELDSLYVKMSKLEELEKLQHELNKESQREEYGSLAEISRQISLLEEDMNNKRNSINLFNQQIKEYNKKKTEIAKEIKRLGHDDIITTETTERMAYVSKLVDLLDDALEIGTQSKRKLILEKSNALFLNITNKPEEYGGIDFESDESYAFVIKTKDGRIVKNPSKGEKQVLAMSFLLGLSQYTGRNNVILMDTPVASLDDVHSAGIGKALSKVNNQVIFLAQPQELQGDIYKNMKPAIAMEYLVEREDYKSTFCEGLL